jgi:hypothetical protein
MSAAADPRLPGSSRSFAPNVSTASDAELDQCERLDLAAIVAICKPQPRVGEWRDVKLVPFGDIELDDDGLPARLADLGARGLPADLAMIEAWERERSRPGEVNVLLRTSRRVIAIRAERQRRAEEREHAAKADRDRARARLQQVLADAPAIAAKFEAAADRFNAAVDAYQEIVEAFAVVLGSGNIAAAYESFVDDVRLAAGALGVEMPELPEIEFSAHDARAIYAVRGSKFGNVNVLVDLVPETPRAVAETARKLRA